MSAGSVVNREQFDTRNMHPCIDVMVTPSMSASCPSCGIAYPQSPGSRHRVVCPYCGSFYGDGGLAARSSAVGQPAFRRHSVLPDITDPSRPGPLRAFGHFLSGRLGFPGNVVGGLVLPTTDLQLPPIAAVNGRTNRGPRVTPFEDALTSRLPRGSLTVNDSSSSRRDSLRTNTYYDDRSSHHDSSDDSLSSGDLDSPQPIEYPVRSTSKHAFLDLVRESKTTHSFSRIKEFYLATFSSFQDINATLKLDPKEDGANAHDPSIRTDFLEVVYEKLEEMPSVVQKTMLKAMVNALLQKDKRLYRKDDLRAVFVLLQCPLYNWQASFPVLAHLLRFICSLSSTDHQILMGWMRRFSPDQMRRLVKNLLQFLTISQFTNANDTRTMAHPPRRWWVPSATKVLALLYAVNNSRTPNMNPYIEFYNHALDHLDLMAEYYNWQNPDKPDRFSYCQYPFVLSIVAKRAILQKDSEHQMIMNARRSLVSTIIQNEVPNLDIFFLNLNVRRSNLVSDSLNEITRKQRDLKKKLRVTFVGEPGLDMGGLTKEWFLLLTRQIFHPDYGMFVYHQQSHVFWFSLTQTGNLREYNLIGVLMGLAVYNSIILDVRFPFVCYRKLLSPPVVPQSTNTPIGLCPNCSTEELAEIMPDVAQSLKNVLRYEGNVEEDMSLTYQISIEEYGQVKKYDLKPNGEEISVTNDNRQEFVNLYVNWVLNRAIYEPFKAFYLGFHSVCASNALIVSASNHKFPGLPELTVHQMLRPEEVEILVCGTPHLDLEELKKVTVYDGATAKDKIVRDFWEVISNFSIEDQKKFLLFTTGTDRIPVGGVGEMAFKISIVSDRVDMLPISHTCFNQLVLPKYPNKEVIKEKLIIAINNAEGFGLE